MTELEQYIQSYFKVIQPEQLNRISSLFRPMILKKGDYFLQTGKVCDQLCFIQSGLLRVFTATDDKEITQWIATKGYFGTDLSSFFFKSPSRWTIQALSDTEIYSITNIDYHKITNIVPTWYELEKNFIIQCITYMEDRIFSHLSMSAEERYNSFFETNKELFNQVPLQYIASILGMTPETFSRIRKKQLM
ncbi:Crp/Fnr family transcriptional regulator [Chryseobacterium shigense]|uniref:CRP-like cAMP-binding protein n=1 Tax=Chryseobacterium shigense TaxID=297244 RepID=A0A841N793_9FLAO|nr:Crp/Fnr family transcriptional regulator [Chryseobacterium shigense]MBB6369348.1 CRP-like cAMP-binding protein [Chryseobacterium shigense]